MPAPEPGSCRPRDGLDSRVERALTLAAQNSTTRERARRSLGLLLEWTRHTHAAWESSRLTMSGSPVEFAFRSADDALRYCVEVADPRTCRTHRLHQAVSALERLDAPGVGHDVLRQMARLQAGRALAFGAWIGGRHTADGDRYKLYVEVPADMATDAHRWSERIVGPLALPSGQGARVALIGYDLAARRIEFYYRAHDLLPTTVTVLLQRIQMPSSAGTLLGLLEQAYRFSRAGRLPSRDVGFSYSVPLSGGKAIFSIYFFCFTLFGGDGSARSRILQLSAANDWYLPGYEVLSRPIATATGTPTRHGMFGLAVGGGATADLIVGLSAP